MLWILAGFALAIFISQKYILFAQSGLLNFLLLYFLISLLRRRLFLPGKWGTALSLQGAKAALVSLIFIIVLLFWGIYWRYYYFVGLKNFLAPTILTLIYTYILIEILFRIDDYRRMVR